MLIETKLELFINLKTDFHSKRFLSKSNSQQKGSNVPKIRVFYKGKTPHSMSYQPKGIPIYKRTGYIYTDLIGQTISVYNGSYFFNYVVRVNALGHKFGEFSFTKQWGGSLIHRGNKTEVKQSKLKKKTTKVTKTTQTKKSSAGNKKLSKRALKTRKSQSKKTGRMKKGR